MLGSAEDSCSRKVSTMAKKPFEVSQEDAVDLLSQLSYKGVNKADADKLSKLLKALPKKLDEGDDDDLNKKARRTLDDVTEAVKKGRAIEVSGDDGDDDDDEEEDEKPAKKSAKKGKKADKEEKPAKKAKADKDEKKAKKGGALRTSKGGKGEFSVKTQQGHEINRLIEKGPTTVEEIAKKGSKNIEMTEKRVQAHVDYLEGLGRVTVTKKGKITLVD